MRKMLVALSFVAAAACSKSKCEKYGDMEVKCGNIPEKEASMTRSLATGICSEAGNAPAEAKELSEHIAKEAECAEKFTECTAYKQCTDAVK